MIVCRSILFLKKLKKQKWSLSLNKTVLHPVFTRFLLEHFFFSQSVRTYKYKHVCSAIGEYKSNDSVPG